MAGTAGSSQPEIIDTRALGKPKSYSGNKAEFPSFKYAFKNYISAVNQTMGDRLHAAESEVQPILLSSMGDEARAHVTFSFVDSSRANRNFCEINQFLNSIESTTWMYKHGVV